MGLYYVQKLLFNLYNDLELRKSYKSNPKEVLKGYDLADSEIKALLNLDVGTLYRLGSHTFLLWQFGRIMDVKPEVYFKQIRGG
ncbi:MAG: hypothetical protein IH796_09865 [Deltaproteobacteria bacterium]|nr:hypothetical protein [Deltaproteobacteria bacterium]